ncbi:hypothetical protein WG66_003377 [Moniliophthora roreri]|nr:hypothetical protein WG66_003377 [Moniliophthora roreri]
MLFSTLLVAATAAGLSVLPASGSLRSPSNSSVAVGQLPNANNDSWSGFSRMLPFIEAPSRTEQQPVVLSALAPQCTFCPGNGQTCVSCG